MILEMLLLEVRKISSLSGAIARYCDIKNSLKKQDSLMVWNWHKQLLSNRTEFKTEEVH